MWSTNLRPCALADSARKLIPAAASVRATFAVTPGLSAPSSRTQCSASDLENPASVAARATFAPLTGVTNITPLPGCSGVRRMKTNSKFAPALASGSSLSAPPPARSSMTADHRSTLLTLTAMMTSSPCRRAGRRRASVRSPGGEKVRKKWGPSLFSSGGPALLRAWQLADRAADRVLDALEEHQLEPGSSVGGDVLEVLFVALRDHHGGDAGAQRRQHLLLDAADRQHEAAQRDLAGHRHIRAHGLAREQRHEREQHRHAGAWPVLGRRACRHMHVNIGLLERVAGPGSRERQCGLRR